MPPASPVAFITRVNGGDVGLERRHGHEHLHARLAAGDGGADLGQDVRARVHDHGVEEHVGDRLLGDQRDRGATRSAMVSHGNTKAMLPTW